MLQVFIHQDKGLFCWYVIIDDRTVLDQGVAKSFKSAENKAARSKEFIEGQLALV